MQESNASSPKPDSDSENAPVAEAYHGAMDVGELRRHGIDPGDVIDFSTNVNAFGPPPCVHEAILRVALDRYPDRDSTGVREAIAARHGVAIDRIIVGNGSSELLQNLAQIMLRPRDAVLIVGPTYSEYARASRLAGAHPLECSARAETDFEVPLEHVDRMLSEQRPKMLFLCNPNNPTGQLIQHERVVDWAERYGDTHFVVDESYMAFTAQAASVIGAGRGNMTIVRSLTKSHALAGLRLGYAVSNRSVIDQLRRVRIPWSVSGVAEAAGIAAIRDQSYTESTLALLRAAKNELFAGLAADRWSPVPSDTHFFLLPVGNAAAIRERLLGERLLVRDCHSFGLPGYIRVAARRPEENEKLRLALNRLWNGTCISRAFTV